ncbi:hypothetical protein [Proteiniphilum sp. X52]|uniref:hypothetical protein n=1 Tax=Proteiniphilum sp. X52 TaxID=2382159 RepID=UPI000F09B541|nr:hypothetical protein [Proteiniphilum sp. X52]RNC66455.1 hypothetical protein D7D25_02965 [Proteiniphilum sp. X52]
MKGICFKEPLFHLTVQGIKKKTRRIVHVPKGAVGIQETEQEWVINPRYKVGEIVYLKEPYYVHKMSNPFVTQTWSETIYKYGDDPDVVTYMEELLGIERWQNKLFMPEKYARHFIKITAVRAERLQDISEEDCLLEGIQVTFYDPDCPESGNVYYAPLVDDAFWTPQEAYAALIDKINGAATWESNPFVWVIDYELLK